MKTIGWNAIKRPALLGIALWAALAVARPALADTLSVAVDLPVASDLTIKSAGTSTSYSDTGISGLVVALSLPFLVGLDYENYESNFSKSGTSFNYNVEMYDIVLNLPIPVIDIAIGAGVGTGSFSSLSFNGVSQGSQFKSATLTQYFASLGVPIAPLVDLHVGYHVFSGTNNSTVAGVPNADVTGDMYSLGIKIGF